MFGHASWDGWGSLMATPSSMPQQIVNIHLGGRRHEERETRNSYSTFWCFPYTWAALPSVLSWPTAKVLLYISAQGLFSAWLTRHSFQYLPFIQYWLTRNHLLFSIFNSQPNNFLVCKTHSDVQHRVNHCFFTARLSLVLSSARVPITWSCKV